MKHFLKTKELIVKDNEIKNKEVLNLIEEREEIEIGTRVAIYENLTTLGKNFEIEAIEMKEDKVIWEVV